MRQSVMAVAMQNVLEALRKMPAMMTVKQAVDVLNTDADDETRWSERSYYYHAQRGEVPAKRVGGRVYVPKAELAAWLGLRAEDLEAAPVSQVPQHREEVAEPTMRRVVVSRRTPVLQRRATRLALRRA